MMKKRFFLDLYRYFTDSVFLDNGTNLEEKIEFAIVANEPNCLFSRDGSEVTLRVYGFKFVVYDNLWGESFSEGLPLNQS